MQTTIFIIKQFLDKPERQTLLYVAIKNNGLIIIQWKSLNLSLKNHNVMYFVMLEDMPKL